MRDNFSYFKLVLDVEGFVVCDGARESSAVWLVGAAAQPIFQFTGGGGSAIHRLEHTADIGRRKRASGFFGCNGAGGYRKVRAGGFHVLAGDLNPNVELGLKRRTRLHRERKGRVEGLVGIDGDVGPGNNVVHDVRIGRGNHGMGELFGDVENHLDARKGGCAGIFHLEFHGKRLAWHSRGDGRAFVADRVRGSGCGRERQDETGNYGYNCGQPSNGVFHA